MDSCERRSEQEVPHKSRGQSNGGYAKSVSDSAAGLENPCESGFEGAEL